MPKTPKKKAKKLSFINLLGFYRRERKNVSSKAGALI
jgi:hypothetical protein